MRVALLHNPIAGRGRGEAVAREIAGALHAAGHVVRAADVRTGASQTKELLAWCEAAVVAGGDGTLHRLLPLVVGSGVAIYHAALGTENLFAREFGHAPRARAIAASLAAGRVRDVDVGVLRVGAESRLFAIMASVGPDASVVHRMARARQGAITHASYLGPVLAELRAPSLPRMSVRVDGREVVRERPGMVVVANLRRYALGLDPAPEARGDDGLLDVVFLPAASAWRALANLVACRFRVAPVSGAVWARGETAELKSGKACPVQADGEAVDAGNRTSSEPSCITVNVHSEKLRVFQRAG